MNYTIKKTELVKLSAARELQTRETAESYFRETGLVIGGGAGENAPGVPHVAPVAACSVY